MIEGIKFYANNPSMIGKTFLRLERDFDKHVNYCRDESSAQEFLFNNENAREYFEVRLVYNEIHIYFSYRMKKENHGDKRWRNRESGEKRKIRDQNNSSKTF